MAQETLEERVAYLEGKVEEQGRGATELRGSVQQVSQQVAFLDQKVDRFREELSGRIDALDQKVERFREELSGRIDALDQKVDRFRDELSGRITALDEGLSRRIDALDRKLTRQFMWTVGIQITVLVAVVGALAAALLRG